MLPTTLLTNEVKDRAGVEVEFEHYSLEGRTHIYARKGGNPSLPCILKVAHQEAGSGLGATQRSQCRVDMDVVGKSGKTVRCSAYKVVVIPKGELDDLDDVKDVSAMLDSFCSTTGAGTTVLFDGSGNGDSALINATL
jgi:hypothetical protein